MSGCLRTFLYGASMVALAAGSPADGAVAPSLQEKVDSLFVIASTGEIRYKDMVQPAKDSLVAIGADAVPILAKKPKMRVVTADFEALKAGGLEMRSSLGAAVSLVMATETYGE